MDNQFTEGLRIYKPSDKAPDFIKANLLFNVEEFTEYLESHARPDGTVRVVIKESREGKYYAALDQYTAKTQDEVEKTDDVANDDINPEDIPF